MGWLTPDEIAADNICRVLIIPNDRDTVMAVNGAIYELTLRSNWTQFGSVTPAEIATRMFTMYTDYLVSECGMTCEEVAQCFIDQNEALMSALAGALKTNLLLRNAIMEVIVEEGGGTPGVPLSGDQATSDTLPENVFTDDLCDYDSLWGAILYLVQSGNRAITDFFEVLEVASNTLENMEIVSKTIPAAGDYISAAAGFADQLGEVIAEGYSGAYTEDYEIDLACDIFCLAKVDCTLSVDGLMTIINNRLTAPIDLADFGEIMLGIATGTWIGDELADVAFLVFFAALRFGQQFADTVGIRPLTVLMSLGADQLASNNHETLCDCVDCTGVPSWRDAAPGLFECGTFVQTDNLDGTWTVVFSSEYSPSANRIAIVEESTGCCWRVLESTYSMIPENLNAYYTCGANPNDGDYGNGAVLGSAGVGMCVAGILASSVSSAFTITLKIELCS